MKRHYGVIKDRTTSDEFINKFRELSKSPSVILSDYGYLTSVGNDAKARTLQSLYASGAIKEAMTEISEMTVLEDLTKGPDAANLTSLEKENSSIIRFASNLYLVVTRGLTTEEIAQGKTYDDGWSDHLARMKIIHGFEEEVTSTVEETVDGQTTEKTVKEKVKRVSVFHFGSNNSNALAPCIAYEMTATYSNDILVKLAWCSESCPSDEQSLKNPMSSLDINTYKAFVKDDKHDPSGIVMCNATGDGHSDYVFGAKGPRGGFVFHKMKQGAAFYGISIFQTDGSPLYTWSGTSRPWNELDPTGEYARNINAGGIGRIISMENDRLGNPIVKMAALAPIFCPSMDDFAATAKWSPQSPHDYSYFDKSGHIFLRTTSSGNMAESTPVYFADHGLYLHDGALGNFKRTDRTLPDAKPINVMVVERPDLPDYISEADRFYAYFDCRDGVSSSGWASAFDSDYDMKFVGLPTINEDHSVTFLNSATDPSSGWCKALYGELPTLGSSTSSLMIMVAKFNLPEWSSADRSGDKPYPFIAGYIPGDDIKDDMLNNGDAAHIGIVHEASSVQYMASWTYGTGDNDRGYSQVLNDVPYIIVMYPARNSNAFYYLAYRINSDGTYEQESTKDEYRLKSNLNDFISGKNLSMRFYLGGYSNNDAAWRNGALQIGNKTGGGKAWSGVDSKYSAYPVSITCKFLALADNTGPVWNEWDKRAEVLSHLANTFKEEE